jgi:hypothetical protein
MYLHQALEKSEVVRLGTTVLVLRNLTLRHYHNENSIASLTVDMLKSKLWEPAIPVTTPKGQFVGKDGRVYLNAEDKIWVLSSYTGEGVEI